MRATQDAYAWPIISLVRFWSNHHLLALLDRPVWRVLKGRSQAYVHAITAHLNDVRTSSPVESVKRLPGGVGVEVIVRGKPPEVFDHVVMATHSDITLKLMGMWATNDEVSALKDIKCAQAAPSQSQAKPSRTAAHTPFTSTTHTPFPSLHTHRYQPNDIYLHTDAEWMPKDTNCWASWNCIQKAARQEGGEAAQEGGKKAAGTTDSVCVSYWVNLLQNLPEGAPQLFVTLNPPYPPKASTIIHKLNLSHPLLNMEALAAQKLLSTGALQGKDRIWYAGAWCGYGFHEDGIRSAVELLSLIHI